MKNKLTHTRNSLPEKTRIEITAVGIPASFNLCQTIIALGGHFANVGVHGKSVPLHRETLWSQNITITTRLVDAVTTQLLHKIIMSGRLLPKQLISHRFMLKDVMSAYETFGNAAREHALKVILTNG